MKKLIVSLLLVFSAIVGTMAQSANASLKGRTVLGTLPTPKSSFGGEGVVVVSIWVDQYGNVQKAIPGAQGTTLVDSKVWANARKAAMEAHFNMSGDAPALQEGTIAYRFAVTSTTKEDTLPSFITDSKDEKRDNILLFMGIPVDGAPEDVEQYLLSKGFEKESYEDHLTGVFNGEKVEIRINDNHGKVDCINVAYERTSDENDTRIKYNNLLSRFNRNSKYVSLMPREELPLGERVYWNIEENSKYYDTIYFTLIPGTPANSWKDEFLLEYKLRYGKPVNTLSYEEIEEVMFCLPSTVSDAVKGIVWFTMVNQYTININYVNLRNRPRGEDL